MAILDTILADIKTAMKSGEKDKLLCLRTLHSDIKKVGIDKRKDITDEDTLSVIAKGIKQRLDAAEQFRAANRPELAELEDSQISIYKIYQPTQMGEEEIAVIVDKVIAETGATGKKDLGAVMKVLMPLVRGKADGALVNKIVGEKLP